MEAYLSTKELWEYVDGSCVQPSPVDPMDLTLEEKKELADWRRKFARAAGEIWLGLEDSQKVHVKDLKGDPAAMWRKLESVHLQKRPGARFNAYDALFNIRKEADESLPALMARADKALQDVKALRPSTFTLMDLDQELLCMALIRALPAEYNNFASSLLLIDSLDLAKLQSAFQNEESQRLARSLASPALAMPASTPHPSPSHLSCTFCGMRGHTESNCHRKQSASVQAKEEVADRRKKGKRDRPRQHDAKEATQDNPVQQGNSALVEFAGHASALSSSNHALWLKSQACSHWNTDTGATSHMTPHRNWFRSYSPHVVAIQLADHSTIYSAGLGSVEFQPVVNGVPKHPIVFHDVLHVPNLSSNLLSLFHLTRLKDYSVSIKNNRVSFIYGGEERFTATVNVQNIGYLDGYVIVPKQPEMAKAASTCPLDLTLWHQRCSHLNFADLKHMHLHKVVSGMTLTSLSPPDPICEPCVLGKQHRHDVPKTATSRQSRLLGLVHSDLKGPLPVASREGYRYWQTFIDDKSRYLMVAFLRRKTEAFNAFKQYKALVENQLDSHIRMSRDDKGGEFISREFNEFCADHGILRQHTEPNEPHQNGVAERMNRAISVGTTALLVQAKLPPSFWPLAVAAYVHTRNRTPTSALNGDTPYHLWTGNKPDISHFRVFGCLAYVLVHQEKRKALQPHSKKCIFVGYPEGVKAWRFWDPVSRQFIISSHAVFDERYFPGTYSGPIELSSPPSPPGLSPPSSPSAVVIHQGGEVDDHDVPPSVPVPAPAPAPAALRNEPVVAQREPPPAPDPAPAPAPAPALAPAPPRRLNPPRLARPQHSLNENTPQRQHQSPAPFLPTPTPATTLPASPSALSSDDELLLTTPMVSDQEHADLVMDGLNYLVHDQTHDFLTMDQALEFVFHSAEHAFKTAAHDGEPKTFHEAMQRPAEERSLWYKAAMDEIKALMDNGTFELVQLPPGRKAIGSRWVFKVKRNADGSVERFKGRVVAQGFAQRPGFDFTETFAPTPKWAALRAILALAAFEDLHLESVDISSAFLNGDLEEEVYMRQPEGFEEKGKDWVWHLKKSIYGLKQAGRCWHQKLNHVLESMGFRRITCEHSIWVYQQGSTKVIVPVFIDDMTIAAKSMDTIEELKSGLKKHFKLRELGPTSWLLGVEITRNHPKHSISLSQHQYVQTLLERFGFSDCTPVSTPLDPGSKLSASMSPTTPEEAEKMRSVPYLQAVGSLMYLAVATRPDIAFAVGVLARFSKNPGLAHWKAVKHVFHYLKGNMDLKLTYAPGQSSSELFTTYSDADHAGNPDNGRSTGGYVVKMGTGAISWSSRLQGIVSLSTTEAEYVAATSAGQEILWLRNLFKEIGYPISGPSALYLDSASALAVAKNPEHHGRMKHLDLRFYWLRDEVEKGTISLGHVSTSAMPADILTKALGRVKVLEMQEMLGLKR